MEVEIEKGMESVGIVDVNGVDVLVEGSGK